MVVEVPFGGIGGIRAGQDGMQQFFGGCFSIASCDGDKWNLELPAVVQGKGLKGFQYILNKKDIVSFNANGLIDHNPCSTHFQCLSRKQITIETWAFQCKKQFVGGECSCIRLNLGILLVKGI